MPLDATETAALDAAAETGEIPEFLKSHLGDKWVMRSAIQENAFKDTYKGQIIKDRDAVLRSEFEVTVRDATGIDKNAGEKATDYAKRAYSALSTELQTLKDRKDDGTLTTADKEKIKTLEKLILDEKAGYTAKELAANAKLLNFRVSAETGVALAGIKGGLKKSLTGEELQDVIEARTNRFRTMYNPELIEDAEDEAKSFIQYRDAKGEIVNRPGTATPATADELMGLLFAPYAETKVQQPGTGANKPVPAGTAQKTEPTAADDYVRPDDVKNRVALADDLKKSGIKSGTKEFTAAMVKHGEGLPLR